MKLLILIELCVPIFFTPLVLQPTCVTEKSETSIVNTCTAP